MVHIVDKTIGDYKPFAVNKEDIVKEIVAHTAKGDEVIIHAQNTVSHNSEYYSIVAGSIGGVRTIRIIELPDTAPDGAQSKVMSVGYYPPVKIHMTRVKEAATEIAAAFKEANLPAPKIMPRRSVGAIFYNVIDKLGLI